MWGRRRADPAAGRRLRPPGGSDAVQARRDARLSLAPLAGLTSLRNLSVEGPARDPEALSALTGLRSLTLRSITMQDLSVLAPLTGLRALDLKLGGTTDLRPLPALTSLECLELWMIRGLSDLSRFQVNATSLDTLFLQALKHVTELPPLAKLTKLRRVHLETMKGLNNLAPLLTAPALEELLLIDMGHLQPSQVARLAAHPALARATMRLGSGKKDRAAAAALHLPAADTTKAHPACVPVAITEPRSRQDPEPPR